MYGLIRNPDQANELLRGEVEVVYGDATNVKTYPFKFCCCCYCEFRFFEDIKRYEETLKKVDVFINVAMERYVVGKDLQSIDGDIYRGLAEVLQKDGGPKKKVVYVFYCFISNSLDKKVIFTSGGLVYKSSPNPLTEESELNYSIPFVAQRIKTEQDVINAKVLFIYFILFYFILF